jgi:Putative peptidoglycan binding domain
MSTPDGNDREPEDWFGEEEEWQERPTVEQAAPGRGRVQLPPPGSPGRRRLGLAVLVGALLLILLIVGLVEAGDDGESEPTITPPAATETGPATTGTTTTAAGQPDLVPTQEALAPGDSGRPVRLLQRALNTLGYDVGQPDGEYGAQTEQAVSQFQEATGLDVDGVAGPQTLEAINDALRERGR